MKNWPEFNHNGDLPVGIHEATLDEVLQHYGDQEALEHWQIKRDKTRRGIVEVISDDSERSGT